MKNLKILLFIFAATSALGATGVRGKIVANFFSSPRMMAPANFFFADELPIPARIRVKPGQSDLNISMGLLQSQFHSAFSASPALGYDGRSPGPTIEVESGQLLRVHWQNALPSKHVFPPPLGAMACSGPDVRGVTHLHGAVVRQDSTQDKAHNADGWSDLWTVPGEEQIAEYPNQQSARTLWYHDHAVGDTGRNVAAGMIGAYIIHDDYERSLGLPDGDFDVPLIFQAHGISSDGSRYYTKDIAREFYGNTVAVNGKLFPFMNVEPRKYRFRIINASNTRSFGLKLTTDTSGNGHNAGPPIFQIGSDGGFLENTVILNDPADEKSPRLSLMPAERADVIIDFSKFAGRELAFSNNSKDPGDGEVVVAFPMLFKVAETLSRPDTSNLPMHFKPIPRLPISDVSETRSIVLGQVTTPSGSTMLTLNKAKWTDPVTEKPKLGATEIWEIANTLPDRHPFHIHLVNFQVLDRIPFDQAQYDKDGSIVKSGPPQLPELFEMGWKDVVRAEPGMVTRIIMKFGPYTGHYLYHCHILEHEDMDMMRPFDVVSP